MREDKNVKKVRSAEEKAALKAKKGMKAVNAEPDVEAGKATTKLKRKAAEADGDDKAARKAAKKAAKIAAAEEPAAVAMAAAAEEQDDTPSLKIHKKGPPTELEDITLSCKDCSNDFIFTVGEQEFFKSKGFDATHRTRCKECTAAKKARFAEKDGSGGKKGGNETGPTKCFNCGGLGHLSRECSEPKKAFACYNCGEEGHQSRNCPKQEGKRKTAAPGICFAFQKGSCTRGDSCKFSHAAE